MADEFGFWAVFGVECHLVSSGLVQTAWFCETQYLYGS
jgi:hypothetical protein